MTTAPRQPAIPAIPTDVSPAMQRFLTSVREVVQVQAGQGRGNALDRAVTFRDLGGNEAVAAWARGSGGGSPGGSGSGGGGSGGINTPTAPTGVDISAYIGGIFMSWDKPVYGGHAMTEIFLQQTAVDGNNDPIDAPALDTETMLAATSASLTLGFAVKTGMGFYVWLRHVNQHGTVGPLHEALGTFIYVPHSPSFYLDQLAGQISESELALALTNRLDDHDATTEIWALKNDAGDITVGIGLLDDGAGGTEVAIAAGRFYVFDPANPIASNNLFVIEGGNMYIDTAFIKDAYIEQLAAGQITAAKVNSLELNAVNITGGTIQIGTNFDVDNSGNLNASNAVFTGNLTVPNAVVDTIHIKGQAVTIPVSASSLGTATVTQNGTLTLGVTIDVTNVGKLYVSYSAATAVWQDKWNGMCNVYFELYSPETGVHQSLTRPYIENITNPFQYHVFGAVVDVSGRSGNYTVQMRIKNHGVPNFEHPKLYVEARTIAVMGTKR